MNISAAAGTADFEDLAPGYYYTVLLARDSYLEISDRVRFSLGQRIAEVSMSPFVLTAGADFQVAFSGGPARPLDWLGIFAQGDAPGSATLITYQYVDGQAAGRIDFTEDLPAGDYYVSLLTDDSYDEVSDRANFSVVDGAVPAGPVSLDADHLLYEGGDVVSLAWEGAPGNDSDWIGIYQVYDVPGVEPSILWQYTPAVSGTAAFEGLADGAYFAAFFYRGAYTEIAERVFFQVGTPVEPTILRADKEIYLIGEAIGLSWENAPGGASDWIGVYRLEEIPGDVGSALWEYTPAESGSVTFAEGLPEGDYYAGFFVNDGYEEVSERVYFSVVSEILQPSLVSDKNLYQVGEAVQLTWANTPGGSQDWIGIYGINDEPGDVGSTLWEYTPATSGTLSFDGLLPGEYYAVFFIDNGYEEITERVTFSVAENN
jgi:hypothetical protein